jgi:ribonuclease P/MRP protein subunit POP5
MKVNPKKGAVSLSKPSGGPSDRNARRRRSEARADSAALSKPSRGSSNPKVKPWLPVLKPKERYVRFELISEKELSKDSVSRGIATAILRFAGEHGLAQAKYRLVEFSMGKGILQTTSKALPMVIASLTLMQDIDNISVAFRSLKVAGTLKKIK